MELKICGLTNPKETSYLDEKYVTFAGIVLFFPKSKRNNTIENAKLILKELNPQIKSVAVVVSPTYEQVMQIEAAGFNYIQIHGDLSDELIEKINIPILKAFNVTDMDKLSHYNSISKIAGYVFDAAAPGSGKTFDWSVVSNLPRTDKLFILAGGLNTDNVAKALETVKPDGIDVSSGVEYTDKPGKDPAKIDAFCKAVYNIS